MVFKKLPAGWGEVPCSTVHVARKLNIIDTGEWSMLRRCRSEPLLLQRIPTELAGEALEQWTGEVPVALQQSPVWTWKKGASELVQHA